MLYWCLLLGSRSCWSGPLLLPRLKLCASSQLKETWCVSSTAWFFFHSLPLSWRTFACIYSPWIGARYDHQALTFSHLVTSYNAYIYIYIYPLLFLPIILRNIIGSHEILFPLRHTLCSFFLALFQFPQMVKERVDKLWILRKYAIILDDKSSPRKDRLQAHPSRLA